MSQLRLFSPEKRPGGHRPQLRVFSPDNEASSADGDEEGSSVLPFEEFAVRVRVYRVSNVTERARLIYSNRFCPHCRRATVDVLDLAGTFLGAQRRNRLFTSPRLGFYCTSCHAEWSV
ncbi:MAG: hypothetical protein GXP27_12345 [Planctomycetes bacterium]|nr:hypothetical protein [Planctomycetota bacterium]